MKDDFFSSLSDPDKAQQYLISQGTDEWDEIRRGRFTSSEIHNLMGASYRPMTEEELKARPKKGKGSSVTRVEVYDTLSAAAQTYVKVKVAETLTGRIKENSYAYPLVWGKEKEPEAVQYFEERTGLVCEEVGFVPFGEYAGGSPDRYIGNDELLEVKCPWAIDTMVDYLMLTDQWDLKNLKPEYWWQVQANLFFTSRKLAHFVAYDDRYPEPQRMVHITIKPDMEAFDALSGKIAAAVKEKLTIINLITNAK